jgi:hypothetical protein
MFIKPLYKSYVYGFTPVSTKKIIIKSTFKSLIMKTKIFFTFIVMVLAISNSNAQVVKHGINQHNRIKQGVRSGELTRAEAVNLRNGQKEIRQDVKSAKADGVVTAAEKKDIKQDQRKESRKIFRKKHNDRERN